MGSNAHLATAMFRAVWIPLIAVMLGLAPDGEASEVLTVEFPTASKYDGKPVTLAAELYRPEGPGPFPAVVLMHGCGGWQASVLEALHTHAAFFVQNGFVVLNLDSFGPRGNDGGWVCKKIPRLARAQAYRSRDAFDAMKFLRGKSFVQRENIFLMGQSNGGSVAILVAKASDHRVYGRQVFGNEAPRFRAVAAYYPWCGAFGYYGSAIKLVSPLIVLGGARDDWVPAAPCKKVETAGADYQVHIYPNAAHSFDLEIKLQRYLGHLVGYDRDATLSSRRAMVLFFKKHMTGGLK